MVKPQNKRKKRPRKHVPKAQRHDGRNQRGSLAPGSSGGSVARSDRASRGDGDAKKQAVAPRIQRFSWDGSARSTSPATTASTAASTPSPSRQDRAAATLDFIAALPRLPGDLASLESFLPGVERPTSTLSAAALAHLRGEVPVELDERLDDDDVVQTIDPNAAKRGRMGGQVVGLIFLIAGIGFAAWTGESVAKDAEAQHWPVVAGKVTLCKSQLISRNPDRYEQLFAYRYNVKGVLYTSRRVRFAGGQGDPVRQHRVDEKIKVYVNPKDAKIAVLEPGVVGWAWAQLIAGLVVAALGGLYLMLGGRERA